MTDEDASHVKDVDATADLFGAAEEGASSFATLFDARRCQGLARRGNPQMGVVRRFFLPAQRTIV
jgi:hypothetical protein